MSEETRRIVKKTVSDGLVISNLLGKIRNTVETENRDSVEHEITPSDESPVFVCCTRTKHTRKLFK